MKNPYSIAKKAYSNNLFLPDILTELRSVNARLDQLEELTTKLNQLQETTTQLSQFTAIVQDNTAQYSSLVDRLNQISNELRYIKKVNELYFTATFSTLYPDSKDLRKVFFSKLPRATGTIRIYQDGNAKLLQKLVTVCNQQKVQYWLQGGTLLGAVRHQGFIPWDDDTDIAMFRDDIKKLRKHFSTDPNYEITLCFDYVNKSRQIRFRTRNPKNPCFIDIYIYDYGNDASDAAWKKWHADKARICDQFEAIDSEILSAWRIDICPRDDSPLGQKLAPLFDAYYSDPPTPKSKKSPAVLWSLDNFSLEKKRLFDWDFFFPTVKLKYMGHRYDAPREYLAYLAILYGDIYEMPDDLVTHFHHINHDDIPVNVIEEFLDGPN